MLSDEVDSIINKLNPMKDCYFNIFIRDILQSDLSYYGHLLQHVSICGIITSIARYNKRLCLTVDDGTDSIRCNLWRDIRDVSPCLSCCRQLHQSPLVDTVMEELPRSLQEYVVNTPCWFCSEFDVGIHVNIHGFVKRFNNNLEISAKFMKQCLSVDFETTWTIRCLEMSKIYSLSGHNVDFLSQTVRECIQKQKYDKQDEFLVQFLNENNIIRFVARELFEFRQIRDFGGINSLNGIKKVLSRLESKGVLRIDSFTPNGEEFVAVNAVSGLSLEDMIVKGIEDAGHSGGIHYKMIAGRVRNKFCLFRLRDEVVLKALHKLEEESVVVSYFTNCYSLMPDF